MRLLYWGKDGGEKSHVWGLWFIELKSLFSVALLQFRNGSRDAVHSHAFNSISWVLKGRLTEFLGTNQLLLADNAKWVNVYHPSFRPIITRRDTMHKVESTGTTWVLTFRGPWADTWKEYLPLERRSITLTHGRREV